jgi:uncharacterized protein (UPF0261 family)
VPLSTPYSVCGSKTVAIVAAMDTKAEETRYLQERIHSYGMQTILIDVGVLSDPVGTVVVGASEVAHAAGTALGELRQKGEKGHAMHVMGQGAATVALNLYRARKFDAVVGIGGSAGTAIATCAMRSLPLGVPKLMVSTVASGNTRPYVGTKDIVMMHSVVDVAGLNSVLTKVLCSAAGAIAGMSAAEQPAGGTKRVVAASMFGNTTACVNLARKILERQGFEVLVFHATGVGGMTMESLVEDGLVDGLLDLTTTEWADELCGGVFTAGSSRMDAAARGGVPQIIAPGCLDMVNFGAPDTVPHRYAARKLYCWNANVTLMRTDVDENRALGEILAAKINRCVGPVKVLLPRGGLSQLDSVGGDFWLPEADNALFDAIHANVRAEIPVLDVAANINDPPFAELAAESLLELIATQSARPRARRS